MKRIMPTLKISAAHIVSPIMKNVLASLIPYPEISFGTAISNPIPSDILNNKLNTPQIRSHKEDIFRKFSPDSKETIHSTIERKNIKHLSKSKFGVFYFIIVVPMIFGQEATMSWVPNHKNVRYVNYPTYIANESIG